MNNNFYNSSELRAKKGELKFSLEDIHFSTNIAINTIRAALDGKNIQIEKLKAISDFLKVDWSKLFEISNK